jgi:predicted Rossmann fold nucleotide-binding protein DprA/Smf involved in DNA uptake
LGEVGIDRDRLTALLDRGVALGLAVESWTNRGIWIVGRGDDHYPARLKHRLGASAPALLYGVGAERLLAPGGLVIVGSREVDADGLAFTERVARRCASEETPVISGGARGVDETAMMAALTAGGHATGMLADSLARAAVARAYRDSLRAGNLVLCSPYDPAAGFSVGNAMGRNRFIYALGDAALVVSAAAGAGGTWAGAVENLKHRWVPLYVRTGDAIPDGNQQLIAQGGLALDEGALPVSGRLLECLLRPQRLSPPASAAHRPPVDDDTARVPGDSVQLSLPALTADR